MPLLKRFTVLSAIIESTAYNIEPFNAAASNFNVFDHGATPAIEMKKRPAADGFSDRPSTVGLQSGTVNFKVDLHGDGGGGVPAWADTFLPACGLVRDPGGANPGRFVPRSRPPFEGTGTDFGVRTLTIAVNEQGRQKLLRGCMGNAVFMHPTGKDCYVDFSFQGAWAGVTDQPIPTPSYPPQLPLRWANSSLFVGGATPCVQEFKVDLGNNVVLRPCQTATDASGYRGGIITDRNIGGTLDPEAELVANDDVYGDWINSRTRLFTASYADDNDRVNIGMPNFQIINLGEGDRSGIRTDPLTYEAKRQAVGDDEFFIEFVSP